MFPLFRILFVSLSVMGLDQNDNANYGPYDPKWLDFSTCKGPKRTECGSFKIASKTNMSDVVFALNLTKDCALTRARITTAVKNKITTRILFNYKMENPCQHFVFGPILNEAFNLTKSCKVNKGPYEIHLSMYHKTVALLGTGFFYGTYIYKMIAHNDHDNFFCLTSTLAIVPKVIE